MEVSFTLSTSPVHYPHSKLVTNVLSQLLLRNVPGVALYFTLLQRVRAVLADSSYFRKNLRPNLSSSTSVLPVLTNLGNLLAGATARVTVGTLLNPISIVKARYEVRPADAKSPFTGISLSSIQSDLHIFKNVYQAFKSVFAAGPRELLRGAGASALRDGPYAGLFLFSYEEVKEMWGMSIY
jgi:solute carrier family 25, member 38